jgi:hypothetical protein
MAFTGKAVYDTDVYDNDLVIDVAPIITMVSPYETPLLDAIGDAPYPAVSVIHNWKSDALAPITLTASSVVDSTAADTVVGIAKGDAAFIQTGAILFNPTSGEYVQVSAVSGNSITVTRGFGGTTPTSYGAGSAFTVISDASVEGADVTQDTSRPRATTANICQIIKKDVIVSGTMESVGKYGVDSEYDLQVQKKTREALRDLERAIVLSILSGSTLGSATNTRTMKGIRNFLSTNNNSIGTLTESWLGNVIKSAWDNGGTDIDLLVVDTNWKRIVDSWNSTRVRVVNMETTFRNEVTEYTGTFGTQRVLMSRWMPPNSLLALSVRRVKVVPLKGRSFRAEEIAKTGDSRKGMVIGEYTLEIRNEEAMAQAY